MSQYDQHNQPTLDKIMILPRMIKSTTDYIYEHLPEITVTNCLALAILVPLIAPALMGGAHHDVAPPNYGDLE